MLLAFSIGEPFQLGFRGETCIEGRRRRKKCRDVKLESVKLGLFNPF